MKNCEEYVVERLEDFEKKNAELEKELENVRKDLSELKKLYDGALSVADFFLKDSEVKNGGYSEYINGNGSLIWKRDNEELFLNAVRIAKKEKCGVLEDDCEW